ncbi:MAG: tyrosine-type recombinase/integrase [Chloroflexota bacterium]|nr:MAG: site-specific integrase [Chloroflexota bacterium]
MEAQKRHRSHGEGNIRQRRNGKWEARISLDGKPRSFYGKTRREAQVKMREAIEAHGKGRLPDTKSQTLAHYLDHWLADVEHRVRYKTLRSYRLNVDRVVPYIGKVRLDQLKAPQVQASYTKLLATGLSKRSVEQCGTVLHKALADALRLSLVSHNASDLAQKPRPERTEQRTLTADQLIRLFDTTAGDRYHALWVVLGTMGLRLGEALGLKWSDVDFERRTLTVRRALQRQRGKGMVEVEPKNTSSGRTVDLLDITVDALQGQRERQAIERKAAGDSYIDSDLAFATVWGTAPEEGGIHKHWKLACEKAGVPYLRRHDLRHTAATLRLQAGASVVEVQYDLGHANIRTTGIYSHVTPVMRRQSADALQALLEAERT